MAKIDKDGEGVRRPDARLARGFRDIEAAELRQLEAMIATIRGVYERYGFEPLETPVFEYTDCLGKFLPDSDRPNAGVFSIQDEDEQWMSLRYDLTAPLARFVAQNFDRLPKPYRRYGVGSVYRNEKPGPGRYRQFTQFDADTVGTDNLAADAEICMLAADTLEALGIKRGDYVVKVNSRKLLDAVLAAIGVDPTTDSDGTKRLAVLRAVDKLDRLGADGVRALLGPGRKDESGDFTKGAGLDAKSIETVMAFVNATPATKTSQEALSLIEPLLSATGGAEAIAELRLIDSLVRAAGYEDDCIRFDSTIVRGLEYYTGPVFEAELTFEVKDDTGHPVRFGSVGGGGRYDDLVARFTGQKVPATGFSIGVSRLQAALTLLNKDAVKPDIGPVIVLVMDKDQLPHYQGMAQTLRRAGIRAEMYLGTAGMKPQMKYADKRGAAVVVIQGSIERETGDVVLKDLIEGAKAAAEFKNNKDYKASRPAQISVKKADLVTEVRAILARYE